MPIIKHYKSLQNTQIIVWDVTESIDLLLKNIPLNKEQKIKFEALTLKRKKEYLGIRACLQFLNLNLSVSYTENGKPYIDSQEFISVSHSHGKIALAISNLNIGVDIELQRIEKIKNIKNKFIREDESNFIKDEYETDFLHIIWGIKESLYKLEGGNLWSFLNHYKVESFELNENSLIKSWVITSEKSIRYSAFYSTFQNYYLIWVLDAS